MAMELLEIRPRELKFTVEVKKQSSCSIQLGNRTDQYVAFKVKTTSPTKYCVRPNIGIVKPQATCDFTVTMQAQKVAPPDLQCKDKFLVQSTVVPFGTTEEDVTSGMFSKDSGKHIEQRKMKVILVDPPPSSILLPNNAAVKNEPHCDTLLQRDVEFTGIENIPPSHMLPEGGLGLEDTKEDAKDIVEQQLAKDIESSSNNNKGGQGLANGSPEPKLVMDFEELKSKLHVMDSKLKEADHAIAKLTDERSMINTEKEMLKHEVALLRKNCARRTRAGFPFLFVCMVALISMALGYMSNS